jgi:hypothetical protein
MARGWESKSVEQQQAEALSLSKEAPNKVLSPEQVRREQQMEGLRLSRQRVLQQLEVVRDARHRTMLERALNDITRQLAALQSLE